MPQISGQNLQGFARPEVKQQAAANQPCTQGNPYTAHSKDAEKNNQDFGNSGKFHGRCLMNLKKKGVNPVRLTPEDNKLIIMQQC